MPSKKKKRPFTKKKNSRRPVKKDDLHQKIFDVLKSANKPLLLREIYHRLNLSKEKRAEVKEILNLLESQGKVLKIKKRKYSLPEQVSIVKGRLKVHPDGYGFVETEKGWVFIPPRFIGKALDGDIVLVRIDRVISKGPEGRILEVVERKRKNLVGYLVKRKKAYFVEPEDPRIPFEIYIPKKKLNKAKEGNLVVTKIIQPTSEYGFPVGEIIKDLGDPLKLESHTWAVIYAYDLPHQWSEELISELKLLPEEVREEDKKGRKDLTHIPLVTIDGENARDFDDAVCVKKTSKGYKLWVAIADVAHYVKKNSFLDQEAYLRGTSVYFPTMVVPMFHEKLSNHLCSLNPKVDRLAMVVEIDFSPEGEMINQKFYEGIINSHARLTYTEVKQMLVDRDKEVIKKYQDLYPMLDTAAELACILREKRLKRGSLDFDLPEPEIIVNIKGEIENIVKRERNLAHMLIEDFMIAANEAVAEYLTKKDYPFLYRVHESPDINKLKQLSEIFLNYGIEVTFPEEITPQFFQELISQFSGKTYAPLFNHLLLRSLKQAKYTPENIGHFGLASTCYCHFTSPIRRYPDLVVHRTLKAALKRRKPVYKEEDLEKMGKHLSERERTAEEAEREVLKRFQAFFMKDKIGMEFQGIITGVTAFGFFVDLIEYMVTGVVRLIDLSDDFYVLDDKGIALRGQKTGKTFQIGQTVRVKVKEVDLRRFYINFLLA
ncbi:ribonuclease R [Thermodesulfobacterium sp. TA1]|uniref:ribonuclease R n=1 Tax=Thermodesulfobacterium sp. TA1 TaxID=2234087 RepID=UPI001232DC74|nr:ribonuclease R [Thermodesulfobacterium sp. TA1]QER42010.1 ribonuclease R [Thermodesulfobacterium sp. TA1]